MSKKLKKIYTYVLAILLLLFIFPQEIFAKTNTEDTEEIVDEEKVTETSSGTERDQAVQQTITGLALKQPVHVYEATNRESTILRSYHYGHQLKYRTYSNDWYEATVFINGTAQTGYIHRADVGKRHEAKQVQGVALKETTAIYSKTSRDAGVLRRYQQGHILKYRSYDKDWFTATVFVRGKAKTGYIHTKDVETAVDAPETLQGVGIKNLTKIYEQASTSSNTIKTYHYGQILKFKEFTESWYEATVFVKGKAQIGYIHKNDVGSMDETLTGYAQKNPTVVYSNMSRDSEELRTYAIGSSLTYRPHHKEWFQATVIINGKRQTGYIHTSDVGPNVPTLKGYGAKSSTQVYANTSRNSSILKTYQKGSLLTYKSYNNNWYEAVVMIKGKRHTGYLHKNDVSVTKPKLNQVDKLTTVGNNNQLILVTAKGSKTSKAKIQTYERDSTGNWKRILSTTGYIGKNGFAQNKKEGDGKSPVGKYTIGTAFGQKGNPGTKLPFKAITNDDVWVDDPKSSLYNTWQSRSKTKGQWTSAENMNHRLYTYGFVINYNTKRTPYKGSAIFFHVANSYTVGCTGTLQANVVSILKWIDPKKNPVIIQAPEQDLRKY